jgi:hypothetical protein
MSRYRRPALSYVEVLMSLMLIATAVAASLRALGSYAMGRQAFEERAIAIELANQLMAEINQLPFADPAGGNTIALDSGENASNRATFDDIDDYNGYDQSPPRDRSNTSLTHYTGFQQQVTVAFDTTIPAPGSGTWTAGTFKKITVKILKNGKPLVTLVTVRSRNNASS